MPKRFLHDYYAKRDCSNLEDIFVNDCYENNCQLNNVPSDSIILNGDEIEDCLSDVRDNSADRIIISPDKDSRKIDVLVCELSSGRRKRKLIENKIKNSAQHIINVFNRSEFEISNFRCCFIGKYEKHKGLIKSKNPIGVKVNGINKKMILIQNRPCGFSFDKLK